MHQHSQHLSDEFVHLQLPLQGGVQLQRFEYELVVDELLIELVGPYRIDAGLVGEDSHRLNLGTMLLVCDTILIKSD